MKSIAMKKQSIILPLLFMLGATTLACTCEGQDSTMRKRSNTSSSQEQYQYRDISTGRNINLRYDRAKRSTFNSETNAPVDIYVNATTGDTVYGRGQYIVNNYLMNDGRGNWSLDTSRLRVSDKGVFMINGNRKLKTEQPYKDYMRSSTRGKNRDSL